MNSKHHAYDKGYHRLLESNNKYEKHLAKLGSIYTNRKELISVFDRQTMDALSLQRKSTQSRSKHRHKGNPNWRELQADIKKGNEQLVEHIARQQARKPQFLVDKSGDARLKDYHKFTVKTRQIHRERAFRQIIDQNKKLAERITSSKLASLTRKSELHPDKFVKDYQLHKEVSEKNRKIKFDKSTNKFIYNNNLVFDKGRYRPIGSSFHVLNSTGTRSEKSVSSRISKRSPKVNDISERNFRSYEREPSVQSSRSSIKSRVKGLSTVNRDSNASFAGLKCYTAAKPKLPGSRKLLERIRSKSRIELPSLRKETSGIERVLLKSNNESGQESFIKKGSHLQDIDSSYQKLKTKIGLTKNFFPQYKQGIINPRLLAKSQDSRSRLGY